MHAGHLVEVVLHHGVGQAVLYQRSSVRHGFKSFSKRRVKTLGYRQREIYKESTLGCRPVQYFKDWKLEFSKPQHYLWLGMYVCGT